VFRVFLALIAGVVALVLGRALFVPDTWGQYGPYRAAALEQQHGKDPRHGGNAACAECHEDPLAEIADGAHASLACEGCHAPLSVHVADGEPVAEMPVRRSAALCLQCHERLEARPAAHPQINPAQHLEEQEGEAGPESCFDCHEAHSPL
jgi:hypothetical protein